MKETEVKSLKLMLSRISDQDDLFILLRADSK